MMMQSIQAENNYSNLPSNVPFSVGGSLSEKDPTYIVRQADTDLFEALQAENFCYVLNSRQMGKSSLRVRTMQRLKEAGFACAAVDLTGIGNQLTEEQWYCGIVDELIKSFQLSELANWRTWWRNQAPLAHMQRWGKFLEEILLVEVKQKIVIFIDEIDGVRGLPFASDDFFAHIRYCYNRRTDYLDYQRLTFCLLGTATPSDLIQDKRRTPFNIGQAIELTGFELEETTPLMEGLSSRTKNPRALLNAVLEWTGGQPFLTQKVCSLILESGLPLTSGKEDTIVSQIVNAKVIEHWEAQDEPQHLRTIRDRILFRSERHAERLLELYQAILEEGHIPADNSAEQAELRLTGLVVKQQGVLRAYNPIYQAVYNLEWVQEEIRKLKETQRRIICQRYEVIERLDADLDTQGNRIVLPTYLVKDIQHPGKIQCILKQITPPNHTVEFEKIRETFTRTYLDFQQLNSHSTHQIPNLIASFDEEKEFYIVQEYIEGYNLDYDIKAGKSWSEEDVVTLLIDILELVKFVHDQNLYHLNLKPSNLRRREQDKRITLIDFGTFKQISAQIANPDKEVQPQSVNSPGYVPRDNAENWTETELDIYAVGMIGIYALTGIAPEALPIDKSTGLVVWRFAMPNRTMVQVSNPFAKILDRMIGQYPVERYTKVSQILEDLNAYQEAPKPNSGWLANKRIVVGCVAGLFLTNAAGFWWYRNSLGQQTESWKRQTIAQLVELCQKPIQSEKGGNNPINAGVVATAKQVEQACEQLLQNEQSATNRTAYLKQQGRALLLIGSSSRTLNHEEDAKEYLTKAQKVFEDAQQINPNDPQTHFYLGFAKQIGGDRDFMSDYFKSIELYRQAELNQLQAEDTPIMAKLADLLVKEPRKPARSPEFFKSADELYQRSIDLKPEQPYLVNLYYNRGVLNDGNGKRPLVIFADAIRVDSANPAINTYYDKCIRDRSANPSLCEAPNSTLPSILPVYSCKAYPYLAVAKPGAKLNERDHLCN